MRLLESLIRSWIYKSSDLCNNCKAGRQFVSKCFVRFAEHVAYNYRKCHVSLLFYLDFSNFEGCRWFEYYLSACSFLFKMLLFSLLGSLHYYDFTCHSEFVLLSKWFMSHALLKPFLGCVSFTCYRENCSQELSTCSEVVQLIAFALKLTPAASHQLSGLWHLLHLKEVRTSFSLISFVEVFNRLFKIGISLRFLTCSFSTCVQQ